MVAPPLMSPRSGPVAFRFAVLSWFTPTPRGTRVVATGLAGRRCQVAQFVGVEPGGFDGIRHGWSGPEAGLTKGFVDGFRLVGRERSRAILGKDGFDLLLLGGCERFHFSTPVPALFVGLLRPRDRSRSVLRGEETRAGAQSECEHDDVGFHSDLKVRCVDRRDSFPAPGATRTIPGVRLCASKGMNGNLRWFSTANIDLCISIQNDARHRVTVVRTPALAQRPSGGARFHGELKTVR